MVLLNHLLNISFNIFRGRPRPTFSKTLNAAKNNVFPVSEGQVIAMSRARPRHSNVRFYSQFNSSLKCLNTRDERGERLWSINNYFEWAKINQKILVRRYHLTPTKFLRFRRRGLPNTSIGDGDNLEGRMDREFQENLENMDYEDKNPQEVLNKIARDEYRRQKAMKYNRIRKLFSQKEPRLLTNDMIQQIRFLYQEYPDEWDVKRLAEGFTVSEDAIRKVLRSKFVPKESTSAKQDNVALRNRNRLIGDAQRFFVDTNKDLPKRFPVSKELKQGLLGNKLTTNTKYLDVGERESTKYKTNKR